MTVMTRKQEHLLELLVRLAGDSGTVEEAIRGLNAELKEPPTVQQVIQRIIELRLQAENAEERLTPVGQSAREGDFSPARISFLDSLKDFTAG